MKLKLTKLSFMTVFMACFSVSMQAQVTIGSGKEPVATLEVVGDADNTAAADGVIMPRLTGDQLKEKDATYGSDHTSAMVYVTAPVSSPSAKTINVTAAGYYYFDGSVWQAAKGSGGGNSNDAWLLDGNSGTDGSNFIGTTDGKSLSFRTNNTERMEIGADGHIGVGTASSPIVPLYVNLLSYFEQPVTVGETFTTTAEVIMNSLPDKGTDPTALKMLVLDQSINTDDPLLRPRNRISVATIPSSGSSTPTTITASNGLKKDDNDINDVELGGTLQRNTGIEQAGNALSFTGNGDVSFSGGDGSMSFSKSGDVSLTGGSRNVSFKGDGNVGIGTSAPRTKLDVAGAVTNNYAYDAGDGTTIDFLQSNLAFTGANAGAFILNNMKNGGTYTLAVKGPASGTASFQGSVPTYHYVNNGPTTVNTHTLYTIIVMGDDAYVWMTKGF